MGDIINKEFEEFQKELKIRDKKLKPIFHFEINEELDDLINEIKDKEIIL